MAGMIFTLDELRAVECALNLSLHVVGGTKSAKDRAAFRLKLVEAVEARERIQVEIYNIEHPIGR